MEFAKQFRQHWKPISGSNPEDSLQSFMRQELEALSLRTKFDIIKKLGNQSAKVLNLQHDGMIIYPGEVGAAEMRELLEKACSKVLGYSQPVVIKTHEENIIQNIIHPRAPPACSYEEALAYPIMLGSRNKSPATKKIALESEKQAAEWAKKNLIYIKDILADDKRSIKKNPPAYKNITEKEYKNITKAIPTEIQIALKKGPAEVSPGMWYRDNSNTIIRIKTVKENNTVMGEIYTLDNKTGTLNKRNNETRWFHIKTLHKCIVWANTFQSQKT